MSSNVSRRAFLIATAAVVASARPGWAARPTITVYKDPG
jgi:hypothetical protein